MARVVLALSGGAESAAAISWLVARGATVVAVLVDLGQRQDLAAAREQALALGAERALVLDRRDEFLHDYAFKALAAGALAASRSPLSVPLSRPVIAQAIVGVARDEAAGAVAYTTGHETPADLLGVLLRDLAPDLQVMAVDIRPVGRDVIPAPQPGALQPGHDRGAHEETNLWGRALWWDEDARDAARADAPMAATPSRRVMADPATVAITFERGTPTAVNGVAMPPLDLLASLATLAAAQGVGRVASTDPAGWPRAIEEAPAALVLAAAYEAVADAATVVSRRDADDVSAEYAKIIREGRWFSSSRAALESQMDAGSLFATGTATVQLHHGEITQHFS